MPNPKRKRMGRLNIGPTLGYGYEGAVHTAHAVFVRPNSSDGGKTKPVRVREMAVKKFFPASKTPNPNFRNPERHIENHRWLKQVNQAQNLGLHIISTLRLMENGGGKVLLKTKLPELPPEGLTSTQKKQYRMDQQRQTRILKSIGVRSIWNDLYFPYIDPKTKECIAVINDFGTIHQRKDMTLKNWVATLPGVRKMVGVIIRRRIRSGKTK